MTPARAAPQMYKLPMAELAVPAIVGKRLTYVIVIWYIFHYLAQPDVPLYQRAGIVSIVQFYSKLLTVNRRCR